MQGIIKMQQLSPKHNDASFMIYMTCFFSELKASRLVKIINNTQSHDNNNVLTQVTKKCSFNMGSVKHPYFGEDIVVSILNSECFGNRNSKKRITKIKAQVTGGP